MIKKKTYVILILAILIIGGGYYWKSKPKIINYTTEEVTVGKITNTISATGRYRPEIQADLSFKLNGQLESVLVSVGDTVKKGQKLATINSGTLYEQLNRAKQEVDIQNKILQDIRKKDDIYNKYQRDAQKVRIKQAEEAVQIINSQIRDLVLYSPMDGLVTKRNMEIGENIMANNPVIILSNFGEPFIEVDVPESDIVSVKIGQKTNLIFDALPSNEKIEGEVFEIEPVATIVQDVVYYKVKIKILTKDERLRLGMSADADIITMEKNNVVIIPQRAVKIDEEGQEHVQILKEENVVEKIKIEIGIRGDDGIIEIISGLKGGENVVLLSSEK